jgi:crotonobetainyl-CoA:carnitine CoA-transferase CaiB-like acyl-CoA transferase
MICPYGTFPTADGELMLAVGTDGLFRRLCTLLELGDLADDARFETNPDRVRNRRALNQLVQAATRRHESRDLLERLRSGGVPCAPVKDVGELLADPQLQASGMLERVETPGEEDRLGVALPLRLGGRRNRPPTHVPGVGEHTREVLREVGVEPPDPPPGPEGDV